jgi:hypothetical protein
VSDFAFGNPHDMPLQGFAGAPYWTIRSGERLAGDLRLNSVCRFPAMDLHSLVTDGITYSSRSWSL